MSNKYDAMDTYQEDAMTFNLHDKRYDRILSALGIAGEIGETIGKIYKLARDDKNFSGEIDVVKAYEIAKELGDVLWFVAALSNAIGYSLSDIADINIIKLEDRMQRGVLHGSGDNR